MRVAFVSLLLFLVACSVMPLDVPVSVNVSLVGQNCSDTSMLVNLSCPILNVMTPELTLPHASFDKYNFPTTTGPSNHVSGGAVFVQPNGQTCFPASWDAKTIYLFDTHSMEPSLNQYTEIVYVPATRDNVRVGDIIVYPSRLYHMTVLHRVVNITSDGTYRTKGDNNQYPDLENVSLSGVYGVVVAVVY